MRSEELTQLMEQIDEKKIGWETVEEQIKVSHALLNLYSNSGPVPVTIINNIKKVLEENEKGPSN